MNKKEEWKLNHILDVLEKCKIHYNNLHCKYNKNEHLGMTLAYEDALSLIKRYFK